MPGVHQYHIEDPRYVAFTSGHSQQHSGLVASGTEEGLPDTLSLQEKWRKSKISLVKLWIKISEVMFLKADSSR